MSKETSESVGQAVQLGRQGVLNDKAWVIGLYAENVGPGESLLQAEFLGINVVGQSVLALEEAPRGHEA